MKFLFLGIVLINIVFFIWEYRKGAPEIYLPPVYENSLASTKYAQKISLLTEVRHTVEVNVIPVQQSIDVSNIDADKILEMEMKQLGIVNNTELKKVFNEIMPENIPTSVLD